MALAVLAGGCARPNPEAEATTAKPTLIQPSSQPSPIPTVTRRASATPTVTPKPLITPHPPYPGTPTPDPTRTKSKNDSGDYSTHIVVAGETLSQVAGLYATDTEYLMTINNLETS